MERIQSWEALKALREKVKAETAAAVKPNDMVVAVGMATCGVAAGAGEVMDIIREGVQSAELTNIKVVSTGCAGNCYAEPVVEVRFADMAPGTGVRYGYVDKARAQEIVDMHLKKGLLLDKAIEGQEVLMP
jgi:(2Fe-2S) ferredoxin